MNAPAEPAGVADDSCYEKEDARFSDAEKGLAMQPISRQTQDSPEFNLHPQHPNHKPIKGWTPDRGQGGKVLLNSATSDQELYLLSGPSWLDSFGGLAIHNSIVSCQSRFLVRSSQNCIVSLLTHFAAGFYHAARERRHRPSLVETGKYVARPPFRNNSQSISCSASCTSRRQQ